MGTAKRWHWDEALKRSYVEPVFRVCAAGPLHGRPRHQAQFTQLCLCRARWVAAAVMPLWLLTLAIHQTYATIGFAPAAEALGLSNLVGLRILIAIPVVIGIIGMLIILRWPRGASSFHKARLAILIGFGLALTCEGMQLGLAPDPVANQMPSFAFATLLVFSISPLSARQSVFLAIWALAIPVATVYAVGVETEMGPFIAKLSLPLGAVVLGVAVQSWEFRNHALRTLSDLRLRRRTIELQRQKTEAERQHALAEEQRREADAQRARAMRLLASALTAPIAEAYERDGHVVPFTQTLVVVFCDAVEFSQSCKNLQPERVVSEMQRMWIAFDRVCLEQRMRVEPLRAEGDARIAVSGLDFGRQYRSTHQAAIAATLAMLRFRDVLPQPGIAGSQNDKVFWPMRIGINIGPVTAGVIDTNYSGRIFDIMAEEHEYGRLWFDVWGDTVNMAARLAQSANPNQILVRERLLWELGGLFEYGPVVSVTAKHDCIPDLTEIVGIHPDYCNERGQPNKKFWETFESSEYRPVRPFRQGSSNTAVK